MSTLFGGGTPKPPPLPDPAIARKQALDDQAKADQARKQALREAYTLDQQFAAINRTGLRL